MHCRGATTTTRWPTPRKAKRPASASSTLKNERLPAGAEDIAATAGEEEKEPWHVNLNGTHQVSGSERQKQSN